MELEWARSGSESSRELEDVSEGFSVPLHGVFVRSLSRGTSPCEGLTWEAWRSFQIREAEMSASTAFGKLTSSRLFVAPNLLGRGLKTRSLGAGNEVEPKLNPGRGELMAAGVRLAKVLG